MKKFTKNIKIFITGHRGMVGSSLLNYFKKRKFGKLLYATRSKLNLENYNKVNNFIKKNKPEVIINCAGKVGGILANNTYPTEFLNENILIQTNLITSAFKNKVPHFINLGSSCIYPKYSERAKYIYGRCVCCQSIQTIESSFGTYTQKSKKLEKNFYFSRKNR